MKNRGFTLIELLGVIIIICLIVILVLPTITNSVNNYSSKTDELTVSMITKAAKLFVDEHMTDSSKLEGNKYVITLKQLVEEGYLKSPIKMSNSDKDITHTKSVEITYSEDYEYVFKDNKDTEGVKLVCKAIKGNGSDIGDEISCTFDNSTENFYVVNNDGINIQMISKYNLNVGSVVNSTIEVTPITNPTGIQSEDAIGFLENIENRYGVIMFSNSDYWYDTNTSSYIVDVNYDSEGRSYPYVYGNYEDNVIYPYVEEYVKYLNDNGLKTVTGNLLSYEQANNLGCQSSSCSNSKYPFVYSTSYWLGTGRYNSTDYTNAVYVIGTDGRFGYTNYDNIYNCGVRPVITIPVSSIIN